MTHKDKGHFAAKHPPGKKADDAIGAAVKNAVYEGQISCRQAEAIAKKAKVAMLEVGAAADLLEIPIGECQLGLFGYMPERRIITPAQTIPQELAAALEREGKKIISCAFLWEIADKLAIPRLQAAQACEALDIKIKPCQLGAF